MKSIFRKEQTILCRNGDLGTSLGWYIQGIVNGSLDLSPRTKAKRKSSGFAIIDEVREHLKKLRKEVASRKRQSAYLKSIKWPTSTFRVELYTNDVLARGSSRLDTLNRGIVTVDEERLPAGGEWILQLQCVLVILATNKSCQG
jgi:hypothetical protein